MKPTIKQQANALSNLLMAVSLQSLPKTKQGKAHREACQQGITTLRAVALIGPTKVLLADELYRAAKEFREAGWVEGTGGPAYHKLMAIVKQIEDGKDP